jgi:hypothetical protein
MLNTVVIASPKLPATDPCDARREFRLVDREPPGRRRERVSRPGRLDGGKSLAGRRRWLGATAGDGVMVTCSLCGPAHPFSACSRRLTETPVASSLEPAGQTGGGYLNSGASLIPASHGFVSQRYSRVNPKPCVNPVRCPRFTEFPQREWGHSARSGTVLRGDRNASPSLLLGRARPAKDYAMTLFPLLPPMMTVTVCGGAQAASFRLY